jgi:hypothetical protein
MMCYENRTTGLATDTHSRHRGKPTASNNTALQGDERRGRIEKREQRNLDGHRLPTQGGRLCFRPVRRRVPGPAEDLRVAAQFAERGYVSFTGKPYVALTWPQCLANSPATYASSNVANGVISQGRLSARTAPLSQVTQQNLPNETFEFLAIELAISIPIHRAE